MHAAGQRQVRAADSVGSSVRPRRLLAHPAGTRSHRDQPRGSGRRHALAGCTARQITQSTCTYHLAGLPDSPGLAQGLSRRQVFSAVFLANLECAPEAATPAFRGPVQPPSSGNFSWARAMRTCAGGGAEAVYTRMRHDTRVESTIKEPPEPPNPSNAAHITRHLP